MYASPILDGLTVIFNVQLTAQRTGMMGVTICATALSSYSLEDTFQFILEHILSHYGITHVSS